jgi:riboflavin kinase/FMN adenylyltransferase
MELIASYGIDMVVCADFTRAFASLHPRDFAMKIYNGLKPETVIVGHDYSFGQGRAGSIEYLHKMGRELGFRLEVVEPVVMNDKRVSSTLIRNLLSRGEVASANNLLNRCYSIDGRVVSGYKRGKSLGFPTANLDTPFEVIPAVGVYSVYVRAADTIKLLDGVANIGYNPTFNRDDLIVEVHILDFEGDFYGSELELYFVDRLRDEKSFNGVEELKSQIARDVNKTREILDEYRLSDHCVDPRIT